MYKTVNDFATLHSVRYSYHNGKLQTTLRFISATSPANYFSNYTADRSMRTRLVQHLRTINPIDITSEAIDNFVATKYIVRVCENGNVMINQGDKVTEVYMSVENQEKFVNISDFTGIKVKVTVRNKNDNAGKLIGSEVKEISNEN